MRLRGLDLNLLVALDALLAERSVTLAARRVGLSQPSMSTALGRLRRHFGDDLLVRVGNRYEPTVLAEQVRPLLATVLAGAEQVMASPVPFDPATSEREFTVMSSDYGILAIGPALHRAVAAAGGRVRLRLVPLTREALEDFREVLRSVSLVLMPRGVVHGAAHLDLLADEWVAVLDADHPRVGQRLRVEDLAALPWVMTAAATAGPATDLDVPPVVRQLELLGVRPRVAVTTESFASSVLLVAGTDRVAVAQRRLVELLAGPRLRTAALPFPAVPLVEAAWWHPVHEHDSGHRWLRERLVEVAAALAPAGIGDSDADHR